MFTLKHILIVIAVFLIIFILTCVEGCGWGFKHDDPIPPPETPKQKFFQTVEKTDWLATAAIIGIAASAFAFLNGSKIGIAGMVSCFIALSMTLATSRYGHIMAICGLIGSFGLMIYSIVTKDKALKEIVIGGERVKSMSPENKENFKVLQGVTQSPSTSKIVTKVKKQLGYEEMKERLP